MCFGDSINVFDCWPVKRFLGEALFVSCLCRTCCYYVNVSSVYTTQLFAVVLSSCIAHMVAVDYNRSVSHKTARITVNFYEIYILTNWNIGRTFGVSSICPTASLYFRVPRAVDSACVFDFVAVSFVFTVRGVAAYVTEPIQIVHHSLPVNKFSCITATFSDSFDFTTATKVTAVRGQVQTCKIWPISWRNLPSLQQRRFYLSKILLLFS